MAGMGSATRDSQGRMIIDGHYFENGQYGAAVSASDEAEARRGTPMMGGSGAGPANGVAGPGVATCSDGNRLDPGTGRCVETNKTQASNLALQNLRQQVGGAAPGSGSGGGGAAPSPVLSPLSSYQNASNGSTTTTTTTGGGSGSGGGNSDRIARPDYKPASDANLLRAKDRQGQIASSALTGLRSALGDRQMLGSGAEGGGTADIANNALQSLTDVNREQMIQDDNSANEFSLASYQGDIAQRGQDMGNSTAQRGQDIGANVAFRGQDVTARGQDLAAQTAGSTMKLQQQQSIMDALRAMQYLY